MKHVQRRERSPVPRIWVWAAVPAHFLALTLAGCSGSDGDTRPRREVAGTVALDGKPLEQGGINLEPTSLADGVPASGKIEQGHFTIPAVEGPTPALTSCGSVRLIPPRCPGR